MTETAAVATAEGLAVEAAAIVTLAAAAGAVYVVLAPLAVWAGLNVPHDPDGAQLQSTPAFVESLATLAVMGTLAPAVIVLGGAAASVVETGGAALVVFAEPTDPHPENTAISESRKIGRKFARIDTQGVSRVWSTVSSVAATPQILRVGL